MDQYNESLSMDRAFYAQDIKGSIAYARANVKTGILTQGEFETIEKGLGEVFQEWAEDKFEPKPGDEGKQAPEHTPDTLLVCISRNSSCQVSIANWSIGEKISILRTNAASARLLAPISLGSFIQAAVATIK
jgi:argininosuccinate lyase